MTNGIGVDSFEHFTQWKNIPPMKFVALGGRQGAAISVDGSLFVWGDGLSGSLGLGKRITAAETPREVPMFKESKLAVVHVSCTRGQVMPTRNGSRAGQEGLRCHVITADGHLWIAGTAHKGMCADHLYKTMCPEKDQLSFYRVGGPASDAGKTKVLTGAAEDIDDATMASTVARRLGMGSIAEYGAGGNTGYLSNVTIVASQPAHIHSLALSSDGRLFAWGCGSDGRTGLRAFMRGPGGAKRRLKCYVSSPSVVEALESRHVVAMAAGRYWSAAIVAADGTSKG